MSSEILKESRKLEMHAGAGAAAHVIGTFLCSAGNAAAVSGENQEEMMTFRAEKLEQIFVAKGESWIQQLCYMHEGTSMHTSLHKPHSTGKFSNKPAKKTYHLMLLLADRDDGDDRAILAQEPDLARPPRRHRRQISAIPAPRKMQIFMEGSNLPPFPPSKHL